jgi:hypothetical protein
MKKNVFSADYLPMGLAVKAHTESTNMGVEPINAFIAG